MECWIVGIWLVSAILGAVICESKGRSVALGLLLGLMFGPIGLLVCGVLSKDEVALEERALEEGTMKACPACAETVRYNARICRYCGHQFEEPSSSEP